MILISEVHLQELQLHSLLDTSKISPLAPLLQELSVDLRSFSGDTCLAVEIIHSLLMGYLHHFWFDFKLNLYLVEMVEVVEILFV